MKKEADRRIYLTIPLALGLVALGSVAAAQAGGCGGTTQGTGGSGGATAEGGAGPTTDGSGGAIA